MLDLQLLNCLLLRYLHSKGRLKWKVVDRVGELRKRQRMKITRDI